MVGVWPPNDMVAVIVRKPFAAELDREVKRCGFVGVGSVEMQEARCVG